MREGKGGEIGRGEGEGGGTKGEGRGDRGGRQERVVRGGMWVCVLTALTSISTCSTRLGSASELSAVSHLAAHTGASSGKEGLLPTPSTSSLLPTLAIGGSLGVLVRAEVGSGRAAPVAGSERGGERVGDRGGRLARAEKSRCFHGSTWASIPSTSSTSHRLTKRVPPSLSKCLSNSFPTQQN